MARCDGIGIEVPESIAADVAAIIASGAWVATGVAMSTASGLTCDSMVSKSA
jgi:hypothetical protein